MPADELADIAERIIDLLWAAGLIPTKSVKRDAALSEQIGLDSIKRIHLILSIERKFGISFRQEHLGSTDLGSINGIAEIIRTSNLASK